MTPKVSVIIPTYNRATKVQNAIRSVLDQTFTDLEIIVVDDGSSDGTGDVLREKFGNNVRYFFQQNQGVSGAWNKGIAEAAGEWIAFLASDDTWEREKLAWQLKALQGRGAPCEACYTDVRLSNNEERRTLFDMGMQSYRHEGLIGLNREVLRLQVRPGGAGMIVFMGSLLARTQIVRAIGGCDRSLRYGEDSDLLFRLALKTDFCYVNLPLVWLDRSPSEKRHSGLNAEWNDLKFVLEQSQLRLEKFMKLSEGMPESLRDLMRLQLASIHSGLTNCYLESGEFAKASHAISCAARSRLTFSVVMKWLLTRINPHLALRTVRQLQKGKNPSVV